MTAKYIYDVIILCHSKRMEILSSKISKVAEKVFSIIITKNPQRKLMFGIGNDIVWQGHEITGTLCCLYKNSQSYGNDDSSAECVRHEVIRMLLRRNDHSHALTLHFCGGTSEFHVYSKKGWLSFIPHKDALVVTIGDQIQVNLSFFKSVHYTSYLFLRLGQFHCLVSLTCD